MGFCIAVAKLQNDCCRLDCRAVKSVPAREAGFNMARNHIDLLSGKVHAVPSCSTATIW